MKKINKFTVRVNRKMIFCTCQKEHFCNLYEENTACLNSQIQWEFSEQPHEIKTFFMKATFHRKEIALAAFRLVGHLVVHNTTRTVRTPLVLITQNSFHWEWTINHFRKYNRDWGMSIKVQLCPQLGTSNQQFPKGVELWFKWLFYFACLLQGLHIFCQGMLASHIHTQKNFIPRNRVMLGKVLYSQIIVYNFSQTKIIHVVYKKTYHGGLISLSKSEKYLIE